MTTEPPIPDDAAPGDVISVLAAAIASHGQETGAFTVNRSHLKAAHKVAVRIAPALRVQGAKAERERWAALHDQHELIWMPPIEPEGKPRPACRQCTARWGDERMFVPWPCPPLLGKPDDIHMIGPREAPGA